MNNFVRAFCLGSIVTMTLFGLWFFVAAEIYDTAYTHDLQVSGPHLHAWLQDLDVEEEEVLTAEGLKEYCESNHATLNMFCTGYMLGFYEAYDISSIVPICFNESFGSSKQAEQAYSNFMSDHPEHWKRPRSAILAAALQNAFPCASQVRW